MKAKIILDAKAKIHVFNNELTEVNPKGWFWSIDYGQAKIRPFAWKRPLGWKKPGGARQAARRWLETHMPHVAIEEE